MVSVAISIECHRPLAVLHHKLEIWMWGGDDDGDDTQTGCGGENLGALGKNRPIVHPVFIPLTHKKLWICCPWKSIELLNFHPAHVNAMFCFCLLSSRCVVGFTWSVLSINNSPCCSTPTHRTIRWIIKLCKLVKNANFKLSLFWSCVTISTHCNSDTN